jgi:low affinity Fe/Cu permease
MIKFWSKTFGLILLGTTINTAVIQAALLLAGPNSGLPALTIRGSVAMSLLITFFVTNNSEIRDTNTEDSVLKHLMVAVISTVAMAICYPLLRLLGV